MEVLHFSFYVLFIQKKYYLKNGVLIGTYPIKIIVAGGIFGFILITLVFKNIKGRISKKSIYCNITAVINRRKITTKAIIDTGNFLRDPISKTPVIVIEKNELIKIIPDYILNNLEKIIIGENINLGEYASKIRIIPFISLGKENGVLIGLKAEKLVISMEENSIIVKDIIIGIYNQKQENIMG